MRSAGTPWPRTQSHAAQHVEILLAAAGEPGVVALGVAVVAEVHHQHAEPGPVEHARRDQDVRLAAAGLSRRGRERPPARPPPSAGIHQPASCASGICGSRDGNRTSCGAGIMLASAIGLEGRSPRVVNASGVLATSFSWHSRARCPAVVDVPARRAIPDEDDRDHGRREAEPPPAATPRRRADRWELSLSHGSLPRRARRESLARRPPRTSAVAPTRVDAPPATVAA